MGNVTESIFSGKSVLIPMADVQHIEKHWYSGDLPKDDSTLRGYQIIMKHTKWNFEHDTWENAGYLPLDEGKIFILAWRTYRHELEKDTLRTMP